MEDLPGDQRRQVAAAPAALAVLVALGAGLGLGFAAWPGPDAGAHDDAIRAAAAEFALDPALVRGIVLAESGGRAGAVSRRGAVGLMQLMPRTAAEVAARLGLEDYDLEDPATNLRLGSCHLARLLAAFDGEIPLAVAAYNAGESRVREWADGAGHLSALEVVDALAYDETRIYVHRVLGFAGLR